MMKSACLGLKINILAPTLLSGLSVLLFAAGAFAQMPGGSFSAGKPPAPAEIAAKDELNDPTCLVLRNGRFQVRATFMDPQTQTMLPAQAVLLDEETGFDETGYFYFSDPENVDLIVRALDGCDFNNHFWVFYGALTKVDYEMTVTDTESGTVKVYNNLDIRPGEPIQDTQAFATCPSKRSLPLTSPEVTNPSGKREGETLLLHDDRFRVEIDWLIPGRAPGRGMVGLETNKSGAFWFLNRSDLNLFVKILDGRTINGHFWLAYTSFTGAEYTMTVTDTQTGHIRTYDNPLGESTFGVDSFFDVSPDIDVVLPWISNNNDFDSTVIINNNNCIPADITLEAQRGNGDSETVTRTVPAMGFIEERAADLFSDLGTGPGYSVLVESNTPGVAGRWVTFNRLTNSPSQGQAIQIPELVSPPLPLNAAVGNGLSFSYLPITGDFISAPVIVNVGDTPTDVSLFFYSANGALLHTDRDTGRNLQPFHPLARLTSDLILGQTDNLSMVAYSPDTPLAGVVFVFNSDGEPAISNAAGIDFVPPN